MCPVRGGSFALFASSLLAFVVIAALAYTDGDKAASSRRLCVLGDKQIGNLLPFLLAEHAERWTLTAHTHSAPCVNSGGSIAY